MSKKVIEKVFLTYTCGGLLSTFIIVDYNSSTPDPIIVFFKSMLMLPLWPVFTPYCAYDKYKRVQNESKEVSKYYVVNKT